MEVRRLWLTAWSGLLLSVAGAFTPAAVRADPGAPPELFEREADRAGGILIHTRVEALQLKPGAMLSLNVRPASAAYTAYVTSASDTALGSHLLRGRIKETPSGSFLVVTHGATTVASIWVSPTERYTLEGETLRQEPALSQVRCACAADPAPAPARARSQGFTFSPRLQATAAKPLEFDVLVVYTPAALAAEGSADAMVAQADLAMADANVCYQNSGIPIHGNIVGVREVDYTESGEIRTDLHRLAVPGDGYLDEVQAMRDEVEADFVCLFTNQASADGYNGYAEILVGLTPDYEELGFSVINVQRAVVDHLFAHEIGHNMGCDHDRENTTGLRLYDFSYGWRFTGTDGVLYRDVMAYPPGASIPYFGTPLVSYAGTPTGVPDYADTARTLIASAPTFVNFRATDGRARVSVRASVAQAAITDRGQARAAFGFERTGSTAAPLTVSYATSGTAPAGSAYRLLPGTVTFAAGDHFAAQTVKGLGSAAPFGAGTVQVALQPADAYVPADDPATASSRVATVTLYDRLPLVSTGGVKANANGMRAKFSLQRLGRTDGSLTIGYSLGGTAVAAVDYRAPSGQITFAPGQDTADIKIRLLQPAVAPATGDARTLVLQLTPNADSYNVAAPGTAAFSW